MEVPFDDFLKILEPYRLKQVPRDSSNDYHDIKRNIDIRRKETTAEHVYSSLKLADYFLSNEKEFASVDRLRVYEILLYHDDIEIPTGDVSIADRAKRTSKDERELQALPGFAKGYPTTLEERLLDVDREYRENKTPEARFAHAIDKMDALVHEFQYPADWGPKGFVEKKVREWFQPSFDYSPTFSAYFERVVTFLNENGYFDKDQAEVHSQRFWKSQKQEG